MLKNWNNFKRYFILISILLISSVNAQIFVKLVDREIIKNLQSIVPENQLNTASTENKPISSVNFLRLNNRDLGNDKANVDDEEMEEEIYAEDEDGNMFLLIPNDIVGSNVISNNEEILQSIKNTIKVTKVDENTDLDSNENEDEKDENSDEQTEITGYDNDDENDEKIEDDYNITAPIEDDDDEEDDDDDNDDEDDVNDNKDRIKENYQTADKDNVGRGHHKKKKIKRTTVHTIKKPFRKIKRIIRRGIKHPKRTFKKVLKAIILPKSAIGILTSSMISNAVGFGSGGLAGLSAGTIAGGIASGIFRNFGHFGKNLPLRSKENENKSFKIENVPIAYMMAKEKS